MYINVNSLIVNAQHPACVT